MKSQRPTFSITTDLAGQKRPAAELFPVFAAAGFAAVHWCQDWTGEPVLYDEAFADETRRLAEDHALRVADVHGYAGSDDAPETRAEDVFQAVNANRARFAARVGADVLVLHLPVPRTTDLAEAVSRATGNVRRLLDACRDLGVRLAVENLCGPVHVPAFFDALIEAFGPDELGFCYDSGHALLSGQGGILGRYADRLLATHLHDNDGTADQHRPPGEGLADWPAILAALKACGYSGTVNLEVRLPAGDDLATFCRQAYETLTSLWPDA